MSVRAAIRHSGIRRRPAPLLATSEPGQSFVTANRPGAIGHFGTEAVANAPHDGWAQFSATIGHHPDRWTAAQSLDDNQVTWHDAWRSRSSHFVGNKVLCLALAAGGIRCAFAF